MIEKKRENERERERERRRRRREKMREKKRENERKKERERERERERQRETKEVIIFVISFNSIIIISIIGNDIIFITNLVLFYFFSFSLFCRWLILWRL